MNKDFEINIAHLYPELLDVYSDFGNVSTIKKRLEWRGIKVNIDRISATTNVIEYSKYDFFLIGGGQEKQQPDVAKLLLKHRSDFKNLADDGITMLAICGGYELLGNYCQNLHGQKYDGLGIFDAYTMTENKRMTGNTTIETNFLTPNTIVGFTNHNSETYLGSNCKPLGKVLLGHGNNKKDKTEGAIYNNVFGTYLHGPLLPQNPIFTDYLLQIIIRQKLNDNNYLLPVLDAKLELLAHKNMLKRP